MKDIFGWPTVSNRFSMYWES